MIANVNLTMTDNNSNNDGRSYADSEAQQKKKQTNIQEAQDL